MPASQKARAHAGRILACLKQGERLPPVRELAAQCGVSPLTMLHAVRALARDGACSIVNRPGIYAGNRVAPAEVRPADELPRPASRPRWRSVREDIDMEIFTGRHLPGAALPSVKELCGRCGCGHAAVIRALRHLAAHGRIERFGRGWRVRRPEAHHGQATLVVLSPTDNWAMFSNYTPRSPEAWRHFERTCQHAGIRIRLHVPGYFWQPSNREFSERNTMLELQAGATVLGYMFWSNMFTPQQLPRLMAQLGETGKPVAVVEEVGFAPADWTALRTAAAPLRIFSMDRNDRDGFQMGEFLLRQGHRHMAIFTFGEQESWCRLRIEGVERAVREASPAGSVVRFPLLPSDATDYLDRGMALSPPHRRILAEMTRFQRVVNTDIREPEDDPFISQYFLPHVGSTFIKTRLQPLFEQALAREEITAWIGISDNVALHALTFLEHRGIDVPRRISVAGFDDRIEGVANGLSSYNFNLTAMVQNAVEFIVRPSATAGKKRRQDIYADISGMIMPRRTTGPARPVP